MEDHSPSSHGALPGKQDPWRTAAATTFGLGLACLPVALAAHWMLTRVCPNLAFTQNRPETFWESLTAHAVFPAYLAGALMLAAILLRWVGGRMQPGRLVVIVICMALAVRWTTPDMALDLSPPPDALHYAALASRFVSQGEHTIPIGPHAHGLPSRFAPGLSLFLAASQWHYPGHLGSGIYCMWLAGALTIGLLWRVGRRLFSPHVGALAALFLALSPSYAYNTRHIMGDVPWSLAVLGACSLIMLARGRKWWLFAGGFVLGAGMLIKQPHLGIIGSIGAGYLVYMAYHPEGRWRNALTIGAGLILGLMPWLLYNRLVIGDWLLSGYHVHDPVMNTAQEAFGLRYVFGPPVVKGVMGNLLYYPLSLLGLEPQVARMLFPLPVSIFAAVALVHRWRHPPVTASWSEEARWFLTVSGIATVLFLGLFMFFSHQQSRYVFPVLPFLCLGLAVMAEPFSAGLRRVTHVQALVLVLACLAAVGASILHVEQAGRRPRLHETWRRLPAALAEFDVFATDEDPAAIGFYGIRTPSGLMVPVIPEGQEYYEDDPVRTRARTGVYRSLYPGLAKTLMPQLEAGRSVAVWLRQPHLHLALLDVIQPHYRLEPWDAVSAYGYRIVPSVEATKGESLNPSPYTPPCEGDP